MMRISISNSAAISILVVFVVLGAGLAAAIYYGGNNQSGSTTLTSTSTLTSAQKMDGVVTGYVTFGSSTTSATLGGYSLEFSTVCSTGASCRISNYSAPISPSGHYSVLLPAGTYSITGLKPTCPWADCSSILPRTVFVAGGIQLVVNIVIS
jgi:hypothetical protein